MDKKNIQNIYELTPMQDAILFNDILSNGEAFFEQISFNINSEVNIEIFQKAWNEVVSRHDVLRTNFVHKKVDEPLQIVFKKRELDFKYEDISTLNESLKFIENYRIEDKKRGFNLSKEKLFRIAIFKIDQKRYSVIISFHHILMDGWCSTILYDEFKKLYLALLEEKSVMLPKTTAYVEYLKWLRKNSEEKQKKFWQNYLEGYQKTATLPQKKISEKKEIKEFTFELKKVITDDLIALAKEMQVTINSLLQTIWGILLSKYNNNRDVVFGTIVSGRPTVIKNIDTMVGLFMNTIAMRIKYESDTKFGDLLKNVQQDILNFKENEYYPLAKIQALSALKNSLLEHSFVFENYPSEEQADERLNVSDYAMQDFSGEDLTVQVIADEKIYFKIIYNEEVFSSQIVEKIEDDINLLAQEIIKNREQKIDLLGENIAKRYKKEGVSTVITASFTSDNIDDNLNYWSEKFDFYLDLSFSAYSQVFQELLDENSKSSLNQGVNVFLIRFEDFIRNKKLADKEAIQTIENSYNSLIEILKNKKLESDYLFGIFPIATHLSLSEEVGSYLNELNERMIKEYKAIKNVFSIDFRNLAELYQVEQIFDSLKDRSGHLPFTDEFYSAYSSEIFRNIYALEKQHFKVIALDCDNTLWKGIVGEDGPLGVEINEGYLELQKFIIEKEKEGFLIVLCSKNNENDVWEVFEKNENMLLKKEHIINSKINWQAKSQNLKEMAQELNVGINSFIFLDDNPLEASEVIKNAPEVLSIPLPKDSKSFKLFLEHIWAFDKLRVTQEDRERTKMYVAETQRSESAKKLSMDDFLSSLELKIYMNEMFASQLARTSQLTQRTNQFNVSTIRKSENDIVALLKDPSYKCWTISVEDKFGQYGLVGVVITQDRGDTLFIDTFLMSCRVLGRGVENSILYGLKNHAKEHNITKVQMDYIPTKKNQPALDFINNSGFQLKDNENDTTTYEVQTNELPQKASFVDFYFNANESELSSEDVATEKVEVKTEKKLSCETTLKHTHVDDFEFDFVQNLEAQELEKALHTKFYTPLIYHRASDALNLHMQSNMRLIKTEIVPPRNDIERQLVGIYKTLLNIEEVGIEDCFFELGGHSLSATRLLSRIHQAFQTDLTLQEIFLNPTIKNLSKKITSKEKNETPRIKKAPKKKSYPLSSTQKRAWLIDKLGATFAYNMPITLELKGKLDIVKFEKAFNEIVERHDILRTKIITRDGEPRQKIEKELKVSISPVEQSFKNITKTVEEDAYVAFDLTQTPLFRVKLFKLSDTRHIFYFNTHHIISDAWSLGVITHEINKLYSGETLEPLHIQYSDYSVWQNQYLNSKEVEREKEYWHEKLQGDLNPLHFPIDFPRPKQQTFNGDSLQIDLTKHLDNIVVLNEKETTTLFMFLVSVVKLFLARYTNEADILLGTAISGRDEIELEEQIGFYANTLVLRDTIKFENDFYSLLKEVKQSVLEAHEHQKYPFEKLVDELNIKRDISRSPLFDFAIALNSEESSLEIDDIEILPFDFSYKMAQFDLSFNFYATQKELFLDLNYNSDLFKEQSIKRFLTHIDNLLTHTLENPKQKIKDIEFLSIEEQEKEFRSTSKEFSSIVSMFKQQAKISPQNDAVVYYDKRLTYQELDALSDRVAGYLIDKFQISSSDIVAFSMPRSDLSVIAILAILKCNATFLPISVSLPEKRVEFILKDSNAKVLLTEDLLAEAFNHPYREIHTDMQLSSSAYVIYTSGTTGNPKGVEVSESSLVNLCNWYIDDFEIDKDTNSLLMIPTSFDASIKNILAPLFVGGKVVISQEQFDPYDLLQVIEQNSVTLINCVPSAFKSILNVSHEYKELRTLKDVALGGESLNIRLFKDFFLHSHAKIYNIYGPTEATDISTIYQVEKSDLGKKTVPIGKAIIGAKVYILDQFGNIAPTNTVGELVIAGLGLAMGYLNNDHLSNEKFVQHEKLGRIYKTGDLAKELESGDIEYIGRNDDQIKINGNRVETGEIEHTILQTEEIDAACVLLKEDTLVAYIQSSKEIDFELLKQSLRNELASYMVPSDFIRIEELPLTQNGKIDKQKLLSIKQKKKKRELKELSTVEKTLLENFEDVLGRKISVKDNFFDIGGNSLNAVELISKINKQMDQELKLSTIFEYQNIKEFAKVLENSPKKESEKYTLYNPDGEKAIFLFPALIDSVDYKITASKIARELSEYKIYAFDYFTSEKRIKKYAKLINSLEKDFLLLGYSSGGNIAFEVAKVTKPKRLILIDSWRVHKNNLVKKEEVIKEFENDNLELNKSIVDNYIKMLNSQKTEGQVATKISLIKAQSTIEKSDSSYTDQNWKQSSTKKYKEYEGFGHHLDMLKDDFLVKNCNILKIIIGGNR